MDITLERILSLIPRKPDGKYVHGAKKTFCEEIGAPTNIISEWEAGKTKSYRSYIYAISVKHDVSVEWLKGETDEKRPVQKDEPSKAALMAAVETMSREELFEMLERVTARLKEK